MRFAYVLFLLIFGAAVAAEPGVIVGKVVDSGGSYIARATVRLVDEHTRATKVNGVSDSDGGFRLEAEPGTYVISAAQPPSFREKFTGSIQLLAGGRADVGNIYLSLTGCDAPGVICDYVGPVPSDFHSHTARGELKLAMGCSGEVLKGKSLCTGTLDPPHDPHMHLWFAQAAGDTHVYLQGMNGTRFTKPDSDAACSAAAFTEPGVMLDGLGAGSDLCLRTKDNHTSHLFLTSDIEPGSTSISLAYTTDW